MLCGRLRKAQQKRKSDTAVTNGRVVLPIEGIGFIIVSLLFVVIEEEVQGEACGV